MDNKTKGLVFTLLAALGFGAAAPVAKFVFSYDITPSFMLAIRFFIASLFLWGYIFSNRNKINYKLEKRQLGVMVIIGGLVYFLTTTFYFNAIRFIPVSLHVMIFYTYPFMVNIFSFFVLKEKITMKQFFAMLIAFAGLLLTISLSTTGLSSFGIMLSLLAALCNGSYLLLLGIKTIKDVDSVVTAAYTNLFSAISFFSYCAVKGELHVSMPIEGWLGIVFIAFVSTSVAIIALSKGIRIIGASRASIISTIEPIEGILISFMFLGESMNIKQIIGVVLILSAIIYMNTSSKNSEEIVLDNLA